MRILRRILRQLSFLGINLNVDEFTQVNSLRGKPKLLIVAPGELTIPPEGWGAVETIIHETIPIYIEEGFEVWLLNSKSLVTWKRARKIKFNIVLLHADYLAKRTRKTFSGIPIIGVCHYGLVNSPEYWHRSFSNTINELAKLNSICCLSEEIENTLKAFIPGNKLFVSPNGSDFRPFVGRNDKGPFICIGKVEERKRQFEIYSEFKKANIPITFIGEIVDSRVKERIKKDKGIQQAFPGPWSREEIKNNLHQNRALILFSRGEADALVLYEAQLAGLPIVCASSAIGAQDVNLPWIKVVNEMEDVATLTALVSQIEQSPSEISQYALENYNWKRRNRELVNRIKKLSGGSND